MLSVDHLDGGLPLLHLRLDRERETVRQGPAHKHTVVTKLRK